MISPTTGCYRMVAILDDAAKYKDLQDFTFAKAPAMMGFKSARQVTTKRWYRLRKTANASSIGYPERHDTLSM
jgi:hypothetical protein